MSKTMEIGPYSAYAIAVKYGYTGTEEQWVKEQETNRVASEQAAQRAEQARDRAEAAAARAESAADRAESAQQATESAKTDALTAIGTNKQDALDAVQEAQSGAVKAVSAAETAATEAVQAAQDTATGAVSDAQTAAVKAVDAKGKEALANISTGIDPTLSVSGKAADAKVTGDKIGELKEDTAALQKRQNVLVGSETGNPVSCDDTFAAPLCGLHIYGKSTQDGTPTLDAPVPIVSAGDGGTIAVKMTGKNLLYILDGKATARGVTITSKNGIISISGTATEDGYAYLPVKQISIHGLAFLSSNVSATTVKLVSASWDVLFIQGRANNTQEVITRICFIVKKGTNYDLNGINVQLELGSTATAYSPYREQLLTLPTPNGLPGIPVTSGGNYTDSTGQQWVCDEVDLERGVKVQRIGTYSFTGSEKIKNSGVYPVGNDYTDETVRYQYDLTGNLSGVAYSALCSHFISGRYATNVVCSYNGHVFFFVKSADFPNVSDFVDFLRQQKENTQSIKIDFILATPIETPLTSAEIVAYKALTAYGPNTVVQASDGAGIKLDYQRDINIAIKRIEDAIASMTTT